MSSTYGDRVEAARLNAKLSQAELGRLVGMSAQAIQYLEDAAKNAQGSIRSASIARACGVDPIWLETGEGEMLPTGAGTREPGATYATHSAASIAKAVKTLRPELQKAVGIIVANLAPPAGRTYALSGGEQRRDSVSERTKKRRSDQR